MNDEQQEYLDAQEESELRSRSAATAQQIAANHKERTIHNEDFLNELRKVDIDSEEYQWVEKRYPEMFSGIRAVSNRGDHWAQESDLRMANKRERAIAEARPGRLLRNRPFMLAAMRGDETPPASAYNEADIPGSPDYWQQKVAAMETTDSPITSEKVRVINGAAEAAADLMSLSRNAAGLDAVSTVKTDSTVRKQSEEDSTASRVGRVLE